MGGIKIVQAIKIVYICVYTGYSCDGSMFA